jgi:hypothetical protein
MIEKTGIRLKPKHIEELKRMSGEVASTPVMAVRGSKTLSSYASEAFAARVDDLAQEYSLPAPEVDEDGDVNHYGVDQDGEFVRWIEEHDPLIGKPMTEAQVHLLRVALNLDSRHSDAAERPLSRAQFTVRMEIINTSSPGWYEEFARLHAAYSAATDALRTFCQQHGLRVHAALTTEPPKPEALV